MIKQRLISDPEPDLIIFCVYKAFCDLISLSLGNQDSFRDEKPQTQHTLWQQTFMDMMY